MAVRVSCPFCNHAVRLPGPPPDGRVSCPRCEATFPFRDPVEVPDELAAAPLPAEVRGGWPLRRVVVVAVALGLIGLAAGLLVSHYRGGHGPEPAGPDAPPDGTVPPAGLAGLRFLPPGCNVVAGVQ